MSSTTKINDLQTSYPLIDADPTASRVISYMRPSDYALWAAGTAAAPGAIYAMGESFVALSKLAFRGRCGFDVEQLCRELERALYGSQAIVRRCCAFCWSRL
jgi:hypothetical protein